MLYASSRRQGRKAPTTTLATSATVVTVPAFQTREFGVDFYCHVPEDWEVDVEPQFMHLLWTKADQKLPILTFQRVDLPPGKALDEYMQFFKQQHKSAFGTDSNTSISGFEARRAMTTVPITPEIQALLLWTLLDANLYHLAFLSENDFSEDYKTESIKFGDKRGEHTKLKQNQLMSGFVLSTAADWVLDENETSSGICSILSFSQEGECSQAKLDFDLDGDLEALVQKTAYPDAQVVSSKKNVTVGALSGATRVEFKLASPSEGQNYGFCYLANLEGEWFCGGVCLSYIFSKKDRDLTPIDLCERSAATLQLPIDPLDEADRDLSLETYENLNYGYRFKFDPADSNVIKIGWTARVLPSSTGRSILKMTAETSGTLTINFHRVLSSEVDLSVSGYVEKMMEAYAEDKSLEYIEKVDTEIIGCPARKLVIRNTPFQEQITAFVVRTWLILQWSSVVSETGIDQERIEKVVQSLEFFDEQ